MFLTTNVAFSLLASACELIQNHHVTNNMDVLHYTPIHFDFAGFAPLVTFKGLVGGLACA